MASHSIGGISPAPEQSKPAGDVAADGAVSERSGCRVSVDRAAVLVGGGVNPGEGGQPAAKTASSRLTAASIDDLFFIVVSS
jgi:hypothetical protein